MFLIDISPLLSVLFLVFMEGLLSLDNALVLAIMVKGLPAKSQKKALTYGIWGAFGFRFISLFFLSWIIKWRAIKLLGGLYLMWLGYANLLSEGGKDADVKVSPYGFWRTVLLIELVDISFSVDSILAAISLSQKYWIIVTGACLGIIMMRFASFVFIWLLDRFKRLEKTAYALIALMGTRLLIEAADITWVDFQDERNLCSWAYWGIFVGIVIYGFMGRRVRRLEMVK